MDRDSWYGMTCERFTAVGLKPPLREHMVASGRVAAGTRAYGGTAECPPTLADVADDTVVILRAADDKVLVLDAVVDVVGQTVS